MHLEKSWPWRQERWRPLTPGDRLALLAIAAGYGCLVLVALWLTPDPRGLGTHEQLGLPPCTSQVWFHLPCPFCGMTTAFSLMAHGRIADAFRVQPAGALMFVFGIPSALSAVLLALLGAIPHLLVRLVQKPLWLIGLGAIVVAWFYKLAVTLW